MDWLVEADRGKLGDGLGVVMSHGGVSGEYTRLT